MTYFDLPLTFIGLNLKIPLLNIIWAIPGQSTKVRKTLDITLRPISLLIGSGGAGAKSYVRQREWDEK